MAKLTARGRSNLQVEYITKKIAYCSDGVILANYGHGWTTYGQVKPGYTWQEAYKARLAAQAKRREERPCFAQYERLMKDWKLADRNRISMTFSMLGDDIDGVWSELNDMARLEISLEEIQELSQAREAMNREYARIQAAMGQSQRIEAERSAPAETPPPPPASFTLPDFLK